MMILYTVPVLRRMGLLLGTVLLCLPLAARAEQRTEWDFSQGQVPGRWSLRDFAEATMLGNGLHLRTAATEALLWRDADLEHPVDVVTVVVSSRTPLQAALLWHARGDEDGILTKLLFVIPGGGAPQTIDVIPGTIASWDPRTPEIGLEFPPGSDVILHGVMLRHWSFGEKVAEAVKSFFTFDTYRPYSINFLWGPLLGFSPPAREQLFYHLPPRAVSAVRLFYLAILVAGFIGVIAHVSTKGNARVRRTVLRSFAILTIGLWLLFDLRMGAELVSYGVQDLQSYVFAPPGAKEVRNYGRFYDVLARTKPHLMTVPRYAILTEEQTPFYQNLRYYTYPSLPILPGTNERSLKLLFVIERPDLRFEENRVTAQDGSEIARDGKVILDFGSGTFLYGAL